MKTLEEEIVISWKKVLIEASKGKGDETAMDEIDRLAQIVRDRAKVSTERPEEKKP